MLVAHYELRRFDYAKGYYSLGVRLSFPEKARFDIPVTLDVREN